MKLLKILALVLITLLVLLGLWTFKKNLNQLPPSISLQSPQSYIPGNHTQSIVSDLRTRTFIVHIPSGYPSSKKKYPLTFVFHGGMGTGELAQRQFGFDAKADAEGFIVVYPDGIENGWNDGRGKTEAEKMGVDDVAFIKDLITELTSKLSIDSKRVYATGPSNGGMMSYRLGCEAGDLFASVGPVIANLPQPLDGKCHPTPIPLIAINSLADPLVPYNGGKCCGDNEEGLFGSGQGGVVLSSKDTLAIFTKANGCTETYKSLLLPTTVNDGTSVEKRTYACPVGKEIVAYVVAGMGHTWPPVPGQLPRRSGPTSKNLNATDVIWDFFEAHSKL